MKVLSLSRVSKKDKEIIKEAMTLSFRTPPKGWKFIGEGAFKRVYKKGNIVVKIAIRGGMLNSSRHIKNEVKMYQDVKRSDKKFFARIYAYSGSRIAQKFIKGSYVRSEKQWNRALSVADRYDFDDVHPDNFKVSNGIPVFFDYGL